MSDDAFWWKRKKPSPDFHGNTYDRKRDHKRLTGQLGRVFEAMQDGQWRTLPEIKSLTGAPEASVSARLRDLRQDKFGGHTVEHEYLERGLWAYRLIVNRSSEARESLASIA